VPCISSLPRSRSAQGAHRGDLDRGRPRGRFMQDTAGVTRNGGLVRSLFPRAEGRPPPSVSKKARSDKALKEF
jgi:hypothetical protein